MIAGSPAEDEACVYVARGTNYIMWQPYDNRRLEDSTRRFRFVLQVTLLRCWALELASVGSVRCATQQHACAVPLLQERSRDGSLWTCRWRTLVPLRRMPSAGWQQPPGWSWTSNLHLRADAILTSCDAGAVAICSRARNV